MKLTEVAQQESFAEKYTKVLIRKLQSKFKRAAFELTPILNFIAQTMGADESVRTTIVMRSPFKQSTPEFDKLHWEVIEFIADLLPPDNLMKLKPHILETEKGAVIFLRQQLDEGAPAMIEKVAKRIEKDLRELNLNLANELNGDNDTDLPLVIQVAGPVKSASNFRYKVHVAFVPSAYGSWSKMRGKIEKLLHDRGYVDGMLPVDVSYGETPVRMTMAIHIE